MRLSRFQDKQLALMRRMEYHLANDAAASQVVDMQTDYQNDPQLTLTCVAKPSKKLAETIHSALIEPLRTIEPDFYYYPETALHITIQNIRIINDPPHFGPDDISRATRVLAAIIPQTKGFLFTLRGVLSMPTSAAVIVLVTPQYDIFVRNLRNAFTKAGVPDDKKYFTDEIVFANCTFCRYTHQPSKKFLETLKRHTDEFFGSFQTKQALLISTNAGAHPSKTTIFASLDFKPL